MHIVTGYLRLRPTDYLLILANIQPAELHRKKQLSPWHSLPQLNGSQTLTPLVNGRAHHCPRRERLQFRHPFVTAARKLLNKLSKLSIRAA